MSRACGVLLHPTSLPSRFGIGDLGGSAREWIDILSKAKQSFWQVCPLGPTGYGDSPYQSLCSFAGNTLLLSPDILGKQGLLTDSELKAFPAMPDAEVDFGKVIRLKEQLFEKAYARFNDTREFTAFCDAERYWLDDFAMYKVIKEKHNGTSWVAWDAPLKLRFPAALDELQATERRAIRFQKFLQFMFHCQWMDLRAYANNKNVKIIGDVPYYVAYDSSDTWGSPHLYELDEKGGLLRVAGVPPDYFSETGQLWGNPLYQWNNMRQDGYSWWVQRLKKALELCDYLRLDHFRGFESYWAVPADKLTAIEGVWEKGPEIELFNAVRASLGNVPLIAEDLGEITHGVEELRLKVGIPGMKVLQFAFEGGNDNPYLPCNVRYDSIMYTGTHDNNTSLGWFSSLKLPDQAHVRKYLGCSDRDFIDRFLRTAFASSSKLCIIPLQDILALSGEHRMNTPGKESGNWQWRLLPEYLDNEYFTSIGEFAEIYGREPDPSFVL